MATIGSSNAIRDYQSVAGGFEVLKSNAPQKNEGGETLAGEFETITDVPDQYGKTGPELMKNSKVEASNVPPSLKSRLNAAVEDRYSAGNFFMGLAKSVGRKIMNVCHAVKRLFCPSLRAKDAASFDEAVRNPAGKLTNSGDWKEAYRNRERVLGTDLLERLEKKDPQGYADKSVSYAPEEIGAAFGLRGEVKLAKFSKAEIDDIRRGSFSLQDIKQDPGLQDCWFLSTLSSVLASCGKDPFANIIFVPGSTVDDKGKRVPPDHAFVRLGRSVYNVPLGEVQTEGGDKSVSNSKPWVKLLETAMQMHLINTASDINEKSVRMSYQNSAQGFAALFGVSRGNAQHGAIGGTPTSTASFDDVQKLFSGHRPVVLGSKDDVGAALSTGVSPGHAVAVLDVDDEKKQVTVLDPYGHTRVVQEKDLSNFIMVAALPERGLSKDAMNDAGYDDGSFKIPNEYKWPGDSVLIDRIANGYQGNLNDPV